jgi:hypothetical protein
MKRKRYKNAGGKLIFVPRMLAPKFVDDWILTTLHNIGCIACPRIR